MNKGVLLNLPYAGCVWHWARMLAAQHVVFEAAARYQRRTFRSRTIIMTSSGKLAISVPVESDYSLPYNQIHINYDTPWQQQHQRALLSAYNNTPFYEFYADEFTALYSRNYDKIWDFNVDMMHLIAECLGIELKYSLTQEFTTAPEDCMDLRISIEPKYQEKLQEEAMEVPYYQVFNSKFGFVGGLSVLDLLFNMGPEGKLVLMKMARNLSLQNS